jgi:type I restriction enzyme M protein
MVSLPSQLFYNTQIPACLWFLARNKEGNNKLRNRNNEILFIDARELGTMISRKQKELSEKDIAKISDTYHNWRKTSEPVINNDLSDDLDLKEEKSDQSFNQKNHSSDYTDIPGFCKSANIQDVRKNNYILTPGRYIDFKEVAEDGIAFDDKMQMLSLALSAQMQKANELDEAIKVNLQKIGYTI